MTQTQRKIKGSLSLGKLEIACEAHEQYYGELVKLEAVGALTVPTYDNGADEDDYPAEASLALLPTIGGQEPPAPPGSTHLFNGEAITLGQKMKVSVYRTT